jgi:hypothetical protein
VPTGDRTQLRLLDGLYGPSDAFGALGREMRLGQGEDLPGKAWAVRHPIILKKFEGAQFKRTDAATAIGLTCGIAFPVFAGELLKAVVVLLCGGSEPHVGAIELWHNDPDKSNEMRLVDGYYGTADTFAFNSRHMTFPRGYGLPGRVWKSRMPLIVKELDQSRSFLRWQEAVAIGINRGLGIPYFGAADQAWALTLLSARDTPIARRFEIWTPNQAHDALIFHAGDCDRATQLATEYQAATIGKGDGAIGQAWLTGIPAVRANVGDDTSAAGRSAAAAGLNAIVALPVMTGEQVTAVVAWYP